VRAATPLLSLFVLACTSAPAGPPDAGRTAPDRVATLAPSLTAIVLALGGGSKLVAVTRFDDDPAVADVARVGGFNDPSTEALIALKPSLVLCQPSPGNKGAVEALRRVGVRVAVLPLENSLADLSRTFREIADLLGTPERALPLVSALDDAAARARLRGRARPRPPHVAVLYGLAPMVAAGPGTFAHDLLVTAGATNAIPASPQAYPHVAPTLLLASTPPLDALLLAGLDAHGTDATLPDALARRARSLKSLGFLQPGPRTAAALDELSELLDGLGPTP